MSHLVQCLYAMTVVKSGEAQYVDEVAVQSRSTPASSRLPLCLQHLG